MDKLAISMWHHRACSPHYRTMAFLGAIIAPNWPIGTWHNRVECRHRRAMSRLHCPIRFLRSTTTTTIITIIIHTWMRPSHIKSTVWKWIMIGWNNWSHNLYIYTHILLYTHLTSLNFHSVSFIFTYYKQFFILHSSSLLNMTSHLGRGLCRTVVSTPSQHAVHLERKKNNGRLQSLENLSIQHFFFDRSLEIHNI